MEPIYLSIKQRETGNNIKQLLKENGYSVRDIQTAMGFENPQAVYKWITGKSLPSIDNLIILSKLLHSSVEEILVIDGDVFIFGVLNRGFNDNGISNIYAYSCNEESEINGGK
ncbi:MAG: helix-turn-helix transcriptional regulator [Lachnospiraceae bacterium]|nr:helix-turn-helix transcriptional regulator [Lachnospiraceae bacterium]